MVTIAVGTKNPAKIKAVEAVCQSFEHILLSFDVSSGVSNQPFSDEETIKGACNRAKLALAASNGDIGIGLEGGVTKTTEGLFLCNWGALVDQENQTYLAGGARILLPNEIALRLIQGEELGPVMDDYTKRRDIRKTEGAIGIFTNGMISRADMFTHIVKMLVGQYRYYH